MATLTRSPSYSQRTGRCTVDSAYIFQQLHFDDERKMWVTKALQTQLKSRRMCLNDTGNVNHVERSPHFNFFGPRSMIFAAGWGSFTQSQLHGSCCWNRTQAALRSGSESTRKLPGKKQNYQVTIFGYLWQRPITRSHKGPTGNFCTDSQKLCKIREGLDWFWH